MVDLEGTCWDERDPALWADQRNETEVIEIGAVLLSPDGDRTFRAVVRPRRHPLLSARCTELTGLTQAEVDAAKPFAAVHQTFLGWLGDERDVLLVGWGAWDDRQLRRECARAGLPAPRWRALNLKRRYARSRGAGGLRTAVERLGGTFEGTAHRALDDARNAAFVYRALLR